MVTTTLDFSRITSNLFLLSTVIFAALGWLIAFAGACASAAGLGSFTWFVILYNLVLLAGISVALCTPGGLATYRLTIMSFSAANIVFVSNKIAEHVETNPRALNAAARQTLAAGLIFLNMIYFLWIFAFGAEEGSAVHVWTHRLAITGGNPHNTDRVQNVELGGMEHAQTDAIPLASSENMTVTVSPNAQYPYKAEAIYAYTSNPEDPNEISFQQGEIMDIADCKGKWWQARKSDGVVGIAPSNYLKLLS